MCKTCERNEIFTAVFTAVSFVNDVEARRINKPFIFRDADETVNRGGGGGVLGSVCPWHRPIAQLLRHVHTS